MRIAATFCAQEELQLHQIPPLLVAAPMLAALVVADREVAWQILALNTEKAHNLKERALASTAA